MLNMHEITEPSNVLKRPLGLSLHQLRHNKIVDYVEDKKITSIMDIGCNQAELIRIFSRSPIMKLVLGVDKDSKVLARAKLNAQPQLIQRQISFRRSYPCFVKLYEADVLEVFPDQEKVQMITMVEFIEHVQPEEVAQISENVFGKYQPQFVAITTPNKDFNSFFHNTNRFRHQDHKFQWTRFEFQQYCENISKRYHYSFQVFGVGQHINDDSKGFCTQGAFFVRQSSLQMNPSIPKSQQKVVQYKLDPWNTNLKQVVRNAIIDVLRSKGQLPLDKLIELFKFTLEGTALLDEGILIDRDYILSHIKGKYFLHEQSQLMIYYIYDHEMGDYLIDENGYAIDPTPCWYEAEYGDEMDEEEPEICKSESKENWKDNGPIVDEDMEVWQLNQP